MLIQLLTEFMNLTKILITRVSHPLKGKEMQLFQNNNKKKMHIIRKVPLTNETAANYFIPPVNFCAWTLKPQNISEVEITKPAPQKTKLKTQCNPASFPFCLPLH